jgi:hypothetical protein
MSTKDPPGTRSSEILHSSMCSQLQKLKRKELRSPRQQRIRAEMQKIERLERMTELWGSPNYSADMNSDSPLHNNHGNNLQGTPVKKNLTNYDQQRGNDKKQAAYNHVQSSLQTPAVSPASLIPRFSSPLASLDVHTRMPSAASNDSSSPRPLMRSAGVSKIPILHRNVTSSFPEKQEEHVAVRSRFSQSPSTGRAQVQYSFVSPASKADLRGFRSGEAQKLSELSPRRRSGKEVSSTEEQELKVFFMSALYLICPSTH